MNILSVKNEARGKMLIVNLYMDDLIYTGNNEEMFEAFKQSMNGKFAITNLGKMKYFIRVEVTQNNQSIFINQSKYAGEILTRFRPETAIWCAVP
jgi:hypothetical protein